MRGWWLVVERVLLTQWGVEDEADKQAKLIAETFKKENPGVERYVALKLLCVGGGEVLTR